MCRTTAGLSPAYCQGGVRRSAGGRKLRSRRLADAKYTYQPPEALLLQDPCSSLPGTQALATAWACMPLPLHEHDAAAGGWARPGPPLADTTILLPPPRSLPPPASAAYPGILRWGCGMPK